MTKNYKNIIILTIAFMLLVNTISLASILRHGDRGSEVREIQKMLSYIGYDINIDGIYGNQTESTIKDFQRNKGLGIDGITGEQTRKALEKMIEEIKYTVEYGDNLSLIAFEFKTTVSSIKELNNLKDEKIFPGQELLIPGDGIGGGREEKINKQITHKVERGDALSLLSKKYGTDMQTIKLANNLKNDRIYEGQELIIPHITSNQKFKLEKGSIIWPVLGRITSPFGWRTHPIRGSRDFHNGIDIAVPVGTNIRAVASGTVTQSGWLGGFGKTVVIKHNSGVKTLYAHNSRLLVSAGVEVQLGEVIALSGSTGISTGPHLHFTIMVDNDPVDPKKYLP